MSATTSAISQKSGFNPGCHCAIDAQDRVDLHEVSQRAEITKVAGTARWKNFD
jgi:hypothetical protein